MKTPTNMIGLTLLAFTTILFILPTECIAQTKKMTAKELTNESTSVFYGKCAKVESAWTKEKDMIFTTVTLIPEDYLKGNLGNEVTVTIPGGQVDDIIYEVSEMPVFRTGEEVVAFIWEHPSGKKTGYRWIPGKNEDRTRCEDGPKNGFAKASEHLNSKTGN